MVSYLNGSTSILKWFGPFFTVNFFVGSNLVCLSAMTLGISADASPRTPA